MRLLKYLIVFSLGLISLLSILVIALYFNLGILLNIDRFKYALDQYKVFKSYSWAEGIIDVENDGLLAKKLVVDFEDFCFEYKKDSLMAQSCLSQFSLSARLALTPPFITYLSPLLVKSQILTLSKAEDTPTPIETEGSEIDISKYYSYLWSQFVPPLDIEFKKIAANINKFELNFPLQIVKEMDKLNILSAPYELMATDRSIHLLTNEVIQLPFKENRFDLKKVNLSLVIGKSIDLTFFSLLEFIEINLQSQFPGIIHTDKIEDVIASLLNNLKLHILAPQVKKNMAATLKPPYNSLPAPLNDMEGDVIFSFSFSPLGGGQHLGKGELNLDLKSKFQQLSLSAKPELKISSLDYSLSDISLNLIFNKVLLELPKFSKKTLPPQFIPDSRFKLSADLAKSNSEKTKAPFSLDFLVKAEKENSLQLKTNFIEDVIRLNFNFLIEDSELVKGYVRLLPLEFKLLKRPVKIEQLWINLAGNKRPEINAKIMFNLPEYKITLLLQGLLDSPRYMFESDPPLPQSDIYSVLLFGRPLNDMGADSTMATQQTRQLISQGLLSLTVLYVLSGTPIEYIGYDAAAKEASAQFGLGDKNTLRVSSGENGSGTGIRRSLGKGWYLDSSVQSHSGANSSSDNSKDYGLFLERIISY